MATLVAQSVAVTVAVDPLGALIEGVVLGGGVRLLPASLERRLALGCPSQGSIASGLSGRTEAEVLATFHALR